MLEWFPYVISGISICIAALSLFLSRRDKSANKIVEIERRLSSLEISEAVIRERVRNAINNTEAIEGTIDKILLECHNRGRK